MSEDAIALVLSEIVGKLDAVLANQEKRDEKYEDLKDRVIDLERQLSGQPT